MLFGHDKIRNLLQIFLQLIDYLIEYFSVMMNMPLFTHLITFKHQQLGFQVFIKCFFGVNSASQVILTTLFLDRLKLRLTKHTSFHQYHTVLTFNQRKGKRQFMTNMNEKLFHCLPWKQT